jgi:hypothetical protein
MSASTFAFNWKKYYGSFQSVESSFWRVDNGKNTCFWVAFQVQSSVTSVENANAQAIHQQAKQMKIWDQVKELVL